LSTSAALWIDPKQRTYGLEIQAGYVDSDDWAAEYTLERDLEIEVTQPPKAAGPRMTSATPATTPMTTKRGANELVIRFTPDGFIGESNPEAIILRQGGKIDVAESALVAGEHDPLDHLEGDFPVRLDVDQPAERVLRVLRVDGLVAAALVAQGILQLGHVEHVALGQLVGRGHLPPV